MLNHSGWAFPNWNLWTISWFNTTQKHWNNSKSLYCDWSHYAYLPASSLYDFWTSDWTVSVWVYPVSHTWQYTWFICNYAWTSWNQDHKQWWRLSSRFNNNNVLNFCRNASNAWASGDIWYDNYTNININWAWHNVVLARISWNFTLYLDWVAVKNANQYPGQKIWRNANIYFWFNSDQNQLYWKCYLNDVIFENRGRTQNDVTAYYNLTA